MKNRIFNVTIIVVLIIFIDAIPLFLWSTIIFHKQISNEDFKAMVEFATETSEKYQTLVDNSEIAHIEGVTISSSNYPIYYISIKDDIFEVHFKDGLITDEFVSYNPISRIAVKVEKGKDYQKGLILAILFSLFAMVSNWYLVQKNICQHKNFNR